MAFLANGYSVKYVPIDYAQRAGQSKFHWWKDTKRYLLQVVRMVLSYNPLRIFLPVGLVARSRSAWPSSSSTGRREDFSLATNTLLILFAAFQVIAIGLLADLVVRLSKPADEVDPA